MISEKIRKILDKKWNVYRKIPYIVREKNYKKIMIGPHKNPNIKKP